MEDKKDVCVVCYKPVKIFSIGCCDHNVCFECSTRMRVLCRQNECPICRQLMQMVVFTSDVQPFAQIKDAFRLYDKKYNISFASNKIHDSFYRLLEHNCSICRNRSFRNFHDLSDHMKKLHDLFYCDLCVENLKILTSERKCYTRSELSQHRKKGDPDDRSHRGHPLCEFCDTRYMDNDDLYRHVRRDHLYCHFCDADGLHMYYSSYDYLRDHFRQEHFLCEEGGCIDEKFTPVFRTEIDLRAHRASEHSRSIGKVAAKQARTLEVEFTLKPRARPHDPRRRGRQEAEEPREEEQVPEVRPDPKPSLTSSDFPTLGDVNAASSTPLTNIVPRAYTVRTVDRQGPKYDEHFPGLPGEAPPQPTSSVRLNINAERKPGVAAKTQPNVSIKVTNHRPARQIQVNQEAFPALAPTSNAPNNNWVHVSKMPGNSQSGQSSSWTTVSKKTPAPAPVLPTTQQPKPKDEDFPSLNSKFSANLNLQDSKTVKTDYVKLKNLNKSYAKKATSVTIPVEKSWPESDSSQPTKAKTKKKKKGGSEDTVRKKEDPKVEKSPEKNKRPASPKNVSALNLGDSKPLPTAADWFKSQDVPKVEKDEDEPNESEINQVMENVLGYSRLMNNKGVKPPPGFGPQNGHRPPPGFSTPPSSNSLTFTNSSGEMFAIPSPAPYLTPSDFPQRNLQLVTKVNAILLNKTAVEEFRLKSAQFRSNEISAENYYQYCVGVMGDSGTAEVLPELLVLLPDIGKQQELYEVLERRMLETKTGKRRLENCSVCRQVIFGYEIKSHLASHLLNNNTSFS